VTDPRRANVVGLGLIGASVAAALSRRGWTVHGDDVRAERVDAALARGLLHGGGIDPGAEITVVATPARAVVDAAKAALAATTGLVTDTAGVKASIVHALDDPRFIGGHPMAGSELEGIDGADPELFEGAVWVLTPAPATPDHVFASVASVVSGLGAEVVALPPDRHDSLVAVVSHVPHLTAATLMAVADERSEEHAALLRLAAGGFRDMTRIAAAPPAIWPDLCLDNRAAILDALDALITGLAHVRDAVDRTDGAALLDVLTRARAARTNLPSRVARPEELAEVRIPIPDRPGAAAEVFTLAAELGVNVADFEVYHSAEGDKGVLIVLVDAAVSELFRGGLLARHYRPGVRRLA
jgi:prephenate dehydrogenase